MAGQGRFNADQGGGFRGNTADFGSGASTADRGSFGAEQNPAGNQSQSMMSNQLQGNPHSSRGFRRALERTERKGSKLSGHLPDKTTFGGKGFKKPNYFAQGGRRHGMHISTGAPHTSGGQNQDGSDAGGN